MRDVREYSDSEFYYPGVLFDRELLQKATYFEREKISEKLHYFIKGNKRQHCKENYDINIFQRFSRRNVTED